MEKLKLLAHEAIVTTTEPGRRAVALDHQIAEILESDTFGPHDWGTLARLWRQRALYEERARRVFEEARLFITDVADA